MNNFPNRLTIFRIFLIPFIFLPLYFISITPEISTKSKHTLHFISTFFFIFAGITDFLDGYIARNKKLVTKFGSFLDPIADKFLVISSIIILLELNRIHVLVVTLIILRELYITSLRLLAFQERIVVKVKNLGKWKSFLQMVAIPMIILQDSFFNIHLHNFGTLLIYISLLFSISSSILYSWTFLTNFKKNFSNDK